MFVAIEQGSPCAASRFRAPGRGHRRLARHLRGAFFLPRCFRYCFSPSFLRAEATSNSGKRNEKTSTYILFFHQISSLPPFLKLRQGESAEKAKEKEESLARAAFQAASSVCAAEGRRPTTTRRPQAHSYHRRPFELELLGKRIVLGSRTLLVGRLFELQNVPKHEIEKYIDLDCGLI